MFCDLTWRLVLLSGFLSCVSCTLQIYPNSVEICVSECTNVDLSVNPAVKNNATISLIPDHRDVASIEPDQIIVKDEHSWKINICGKTPGFTAIAASLNDKSRDETQYSYLHVVIGKFEVLRILGTVVGWIYFAAWSISFYPQMYENYCRKSVVGLNFDFVSLNVVGFLLYSFYNCGMYYIPEIQDEYFSRHPKSLNPVLFNDVFFSTHAVFASTVIIFQCIFYERGDQCVSLVSKIILLLYYCIVLVSGIAAYMQTIHWLDFLYYCSYIKLSVTLIKYIPQAVMNYTRKSTQGWCIGNVLLDFTGGTFSILQMLVNGYNYNDWDSIFGDPTKFGLGIFSVAFDIIFIYQHYVLYRNTEYEEPIIDDTVQRPDSAPPARQENTQSTTPAPTS